MLPLTKDSAWTTLEWEGNPGDTVAFVIKSEVQAWQEVLEVAANPEGVLRRLSMGGRSSEVRDVSYFYIANAVAQGTFTGWLVQNAKALNGMSVVVGRGPGGFHDPDRVYLVIKLPPEPRTFKLVIGWRDIPRPGGN